MKHLLMTMLIVGACGEPPSGTVSATWTIRDTDNLPITCERAAMPYVRLTAISANSGDQEADKTRPCSSPNIELDLPAGDYVLLLQAMASEDVESTEWSQEPATVTVDQRTDVAFVLNLHVVVPPPP